MIFHAAVHFTLMIIMVYIMVININEKSYKEVSITILFLFANTYFFFDSILS